ncbi:hypothetical protein OUZ56_023794 [Daphnia magna]|uniref:CxC3 like cysteine cluster domain-containing protein n=1 Tax=Daphnia magna TaxID=35525 RepID=A0ABR0AZK2_9CRUS|nr:hypothetical protein OUZ56_023794 [Daphnia magna]
MYANIFEEVSEEYGRSGPINIPLFTTAEREWETCRHYIDQESKKKNVCGGSAFKAAREDSNENKKYNETGLVVSSCKHCIVTNAINVFKGESWTHTAFMHYEAWKSQATFFCYDVVCQYWKWMHKKVGPEFPEYMMLKKGILPIMHQMAHQLPCQSNIHNRYFGIPDGQKDLD